MESALTKIDTSVLDRIIVGRVEPYIYAFSTETVPNYLKVGDTARGVRVRLDEWRTFYPDLVKQYEHSAQIDEETIFRDFAVHTFLKRERTENGCRGIHLKICLIIPKSFSKTRLPGMWRTPLLISSAALTKRVANIRCILLTDCHRRSHMRELKISGAAA